MDVLTNFTMVITYICVCVYIYVYIYEIMALYTLTLHKICQSYLNKVLKKSDIFVPA